MFGKSKLAIALVLSAVLATAGPLRAQQQAPTDVVAIIPPIADYLPLMVGIKKGFYAEAGINLISNSDISGGQIIPALLSGKVQVAGLIWPFVAIAGSNGLPLKVVSAVSAAGKTTETDTQQLVVLATSKIMTASDLAGKTVAVNTLKGLSDVSVRNIAQIAGVDPYQVKLTPVLVPNMLGLLRTGAVDGAALIEPFLTAAKQQEALRVIAGTNVALPLSDVPAGIVLTSQDFIDKNPELVVRFQKATMKAVGYAADPDHEDELRGLLAEFIRIPAEVARAMTLPRFSTHHDIKDVQGEIDLFVKYGVLEKKIDMSKYDAQLPAN